MAPRRCPTAEPCSVLVEEKEIMRKLIPVLIFAGATASMTIPAYAIPVLQSIAFKQLDWYDASGSLAQADSLYGRMNYSYAPNAATSYLNVAVGSSAGGPGTWVIQNLPLFAVQNGNFSTRRE